MSSILTSQHADAVPNEKTARKAMLTSNAPEERDVLTAIWYQITTMENLAWTVTATEPLDVKPATFSEALASASVNLDQAWKENQVTKETILTALKPLCRFTSAFVSFEELSKQDEICFNPHPQHKDPPLYGINSKGLARLTAVTHGFWRRRSQLARFNFDRFCTCRPASEQEIQRAIDLAVSKVDSNAGEELTSGARVSDIFTIFNIFQECTS